MDASSSRAATLSARIGAGAVLLALVGVAGAASGLLPPRVGFLLFGPAGLLLGLLALLLGVVGLARTGPASGRAGRPQAVRGTALGALLVAVVAILAIPGRRVPVINDITTNPEDPPQFEVAAREIGRPLPYPGESFAVQQRAAYPDVASIVIVAPPAQAFERAKDAVLGLGLEIVHEDANAGRLEAQATSRIFRFVDDVVIRVRPTGQGSMIDVRSRSRDGRGDFGVNAKRIEALAEAIRAAR
jgi:uncharacterized protein (DUF1499 family)